MLTGEEFARMRLHRRFSFVRRFVLLVAPHLTLSDSRAICLLANRSECKVVERLGEEVAVRASPSVTRAPCGRLNQRQH